MDPLFGVNGLMFWEEKEILIRRHFESYFAHELQNILLSENRAWRFVRFEGPQLTPIQLLNTNYTRDDIWIQESNKENKKEILALRPETTPSSYVYAQYLLNNHIGIKPPLVVWQSGKSFRREQDQVIKNMRLKEFYQQEFQCLYTTDTKNDYHAAVLQPVCKMIGEMVGLPTRVVESDRLPSYSLRTMDVESNYNGKWMELCSISKRTDFPFKFHDKIMEVLEVSIGLDRVVYNFLMGNSSLAL